MRNLLSISYIIYPGERLGFTSHWQNPIRGSLLAIKTGFPTIRWSNPGASPWFNTWHSSNPRKYSSDSAVSLMCRVQAPPPVLSNVPHSSPSQILWLHSLFQYQIHTIPLFILNKHQYHKQRERNKRGSTPYSYRLRSNPAQGQIHIQTYQKHPYRESTYQRLSQQQFTQHPW